MGATLALSFLTLKRTSNFIGKKRLPEWPPLLLLLVSQCTRVVGSNSGSDSYFRRDQWQAGQLQVIAESMKHIESSAPQRNAIGVPMMAQH